MGSKVVVRYGSTRTLGHFEHSDKFECPRGTRVLIRTRRGLEVGDTLCPANERTAEMIESGKPGSILRQMTTEDERELLRIHENERQAFATSCRLVTERKLQMELVDIEHIFGGERIVLYYLAEKRVDFRDLVKDLASEFQTRIEMRQIGIRDEARLLADYGDCGKPVCCNTHLTQMPPVSMKMAKVQKSTLDPTKISGRCGRLKCCLRYEYDTYEEMQRELPPVGARVVTKDGTGDVLAQEILAQRVLVQYEDKRRIAVSIADVMTILTGGKGPPKKPRRKPKGPRKNNSDEPNT